MSLWCVWLAAKNSILNWPVSIVASILYFAVFQHSHFFSDSYLQCIFICFQSYGWLNWKGKFQTQNILKISHLENKEKWGYLTILLTAYWIWYIIYCNINSTAKYPFVDSFLTVLSLLAIFLQTKRKIENWYLWIVADVFYVPMFFMGGQIYTSILYLVFIGISFEGLKRWKNDIKKEVGKPTSLKK